LTPTSGPISGGTQVVISGANLNGALAVEFGNVPATIIADTSTMIGVIAPAHVAAVVDVTVVTASGTSIVTPFDQFTYGGTASSSALHPHAIDVVMSGPPRIYPAGQDTNFLLAQILLGNKNHP